MDKNSKYIQNYALFKLDADLPKNSKIPFESGNLKSIEYVFNCYYTSSTTFIYCITREILSQLSDNSEIVLYSNNHSILKHDFRYSDFITNNTEFTFENIKINYSYIPNQYQSKLSHSSNIYDKGKISIKCDNWNKPYDEFINMLLRLKNKYINELYKKDKNSNQIYTLKMDGRSVYWQSKDKKSRNFNTLFLKNNQLEDIKNRTIKFKNCTDSPFHNAQRKTWMLYGPPGTGKSSLIMAIVCELDTSLFRIKSNDISLNQLEQFITEACETCDLPVFVFEDLDEIFINSDTKTAGIELGPDMNNAPTMKNNFSFSDLINIIDGPESPEKALFILTSNRAKTYDAALLRRIDYHWEIEGFDNNSILNCIKYILEMNNDIKPDDSLISKINSLMKKMNYQMHILYKILLHIRDDYPADQWTFENVFKEITKYKVMYNCE